MDSANGARFGTVAVAYLLRINGADLLAVRTDLVRKNNVGRMADVPLIPLQNGTYDLIFSHQSLSNHEEQRRRSH